MTVYRYCTWVPWVLITTLGTFAATEENESRTTPITSAKETASERRERIDIEVMGVVLDSFSSVAANVPSVVISTQGTHVQ
jgi:hypothetical protein